MQAKIYLNKCKRSSTDGVGFMSIAIGLNSKPVLVSEVSNIKELKAAVHIAFKTVTDDDEYSVSIITRGRAVNGFNKFYNELPKAISRLNCTELVK